MMILQSYVTYRSPRFRKRDLILCNNILQAFATIEFANFKFYQNLLIFRTSSVAITASIMKNPSIRRTKFALVFRQAELSKIRKRSVFFVRCSI